MGLTPESIAEDRGRLRPLIAETPTNVRNRGAGERKKRGRMATEPTEDNNEEDEAEINTQEMAEAIAEVIN